MLFRKKKYSDSVTLVHLLETCYYTNDSIAKVYERLPIRQLQKNLILIRELNIAQLFVR